MRSFAALLVVLAVAAGCGDDGSSTGSDPSTSTGEVDQVIALEVLDGQLTGGTRAEDVDLGSSVRIELTGDTDEQVHVHGYDLYVEPVDGEGDLRFDALIPGTFEVELEQTGRLLIRMTVS